MRALLAACLLVSACASAPPVPAPIASIAARLDSDRWKEAESVLSIAASPDGAILATGDAAGDVHLRDARTGALLASFSDHSQAVAALSFSPDGTLLASASRGGSLVVQGVPGGAKTVDMPSKNDGGIFTGAVAFSPDGRTLAAGGVDYGIVLLDPATGAEKARLNVGSFGVSSIAWTPDGGRLLCGCLDGTVKVVDAATGKVLRSHKDPRPVWSAPVRAVGLPDGDGTLVAVRNDGLVFRWNEDGSGGRTTDEPDARFASATFSTDRKLLLVACRDGTLRKFGASSGKEIGRLAISRRAVLCAAFLPDGAVACAGEDGAIRIVDPKDGAVRAGPTGHLGPVYWVTESPDRRRVVTGGRDGTARLWDTATGEEVALLCATEGPIYAVAFSADGRIVAAGGWDGKVRSFDARTGAPTGTVVPFEIDVSRIFPALEPAGRWKILEDGTVAAATR